MDSLLTFGYLFSKIGNGRYTFFVAIAVLLSLANGAPQFRHHKRHSRFLGSEDHKPKLEWVNPCRGSTAIQNQTKENREQIRKKLEAYEPLRGELQNFIVRLNSTNNAIKTSDTSVWFKQYNSTYDKFLNRIDIIKAKGVTKWHIDIQIYVGAFQHLFHKVKRFERNRNEGNATSVELKDLMVLSRNALCEIETAMNKTNKSMPHVFTREEMDEKLLFTKNSDYYMDNKFTKFRFTEYIHNLYTVLENRVNNLQHKNPKKSRKIGQKKSINGIRKKNSKGMRKMKNEKRKKNKI